MRNQERSLSTNYKVNHAALHRRQKKKKIPQKTQPTETAGKGDWENKELVKHLEGRVKKKKL